VRPSRVWIVPWISPPATAGDPSSARAAIPTSAERIDTFGADGLRPALLQPTHKSTLLGPQRFRAGARRGIVEVAMSQRLSPDPEIESLIRQLNAAAKNVGEPAPAAAMDALEERAVTPVPVAPSRWPLPPRDQAGLEWLGALLRGARARQASDALLVAGLPPVLRVNGRLETIGDRELGPTSSGVLCAALVPADRRAALERGRWAAAVRFLPEDAPDLESLNLPPSLAAFAELTQGLVLVTGPTGCGKSTTMAAILRRILERRRVHVITIEDPVEYELPHGTSVVEHVEIGRDAGSFVEALRSALRQNPDVLLIGEMRDRESIGIAITAAETGHLVLSSLHTGDAPQTIHRILDSYPAEQIDLVRVQLSMSLAGIVSQQLLPRRAAPGRVPAIEVLVATHAVRNLVRQGKIPQLRSQLTLERDSGMLALDLSLARLVRAGLVDAAEARARARVPAELEQLLAHGKDVER
jgi:twitching motility protein PilT